jgi:hypothetical protein
MPTTIRLEGGPCSGNMIVTTPMGQGIALAVDENLRPVQTENPFAIALYQLEKQPEEVYVFKGFQRPGNQPFTIEFVDGPVEGFLPAAQPAQYIDPVLNVYLTSDGKPFQGKGEPAALAIYERREENGRFFFALRETDSSPDTMQKVIEAINDQKLTQVINGFYAKPDYDIYSMKPTGDHVQVLIELGHRRGQIDEKIAPLIAEVWRRGLDTIGSCQDRPPGSPHEGKAYISFPRVRHARFFHELVSEAGIAAMLVEKPFKIASKRDSDGLVEDELEVVSANVLFDPSDIDRIVEVFRAISGSDAPMGSRV